MHRHKDSRTHSSFFDAHSAGVKNGLGSHRLSWYQNSSGLTGTNYRDALELKEG